MHKKIHLIGIGGTAMATLAALLKQRGFEVRGSDQNVYPPMSTFLEREGIEAMSGYSADHITADLDLVVVGNAISRGNVELEELLAWKTSTQSVPSLAAAQAKPTGATPLILIGAKSSSCPAGETRTASRDFS
jgi:UDP-N-acetylmuramate: L-alanyl-gamma-D-glutamyl-meso-diaminopimelate ligase